MRLQKFLAHSGVASRRSAEELISAGRVRVNGATRSLGSKVEPGDRVEVDGKRIALPAQARYVVLNKPAKVMTTMRDPEGRRTVAQIVPSEGRRVVPVGRLDYETSGVLLLTDDGDLAYRLTHPRFGVAKTYRALVHGRLDAEAVAHLLAGIRLEDGGAAPAKLRVVRASGRVSEVDITLHEGRNRQVRRMFEATAHPVISLVRIRFGPIALGPLAVGNWRVATEREVSALRVAAAAVPDDERRRDGRE